MEFQPRIESLPPANPVGRRSEFDWTAKVQFVREAAGQWCAIGEFAKNGVASAQRIRMKSLYPDIEATTRKVGTKTVLYARLILAGA